MNLIWITHLYEITQSSFISKCFKVRGEPITVGVLRATSIFCIWNNHKMQFGNIKETCICSFAKYRVIEMLLTGNKSHMEIFEIFI